MILLELFEGPAGDDGKSAVRDMRDSLLDVLMPIAAQGVPYISISALIDKLHDLHTGIQPDRALVLHLLDPVDVKMVSKIEGDKIFFTMNDPDAQDPEKESEQQQAKDKVGDMAMKQAKDNIKNQNGVSPAPAPTAAPSPETAANPKTGPF